MSVARTFLFLLCLAASSVPAAAQEPVGSAPQRESKVLNLLHVSFASLEAVDVYTTVSAINGGAREANPLMQPIAGHPAALIAVKGGLTASTILLTRRLARKNRVAAIALSAAVNTVCAAVAVHNIRVIHR